MEWTCVSEEGRFSGPHVNYQTATIKQLPSTKKSRAHSLVVSV